MIDLDDMMGFMIMNGVVDENFGLIDKEAQNDEQKDEEEEQEKKN